MNDQDGNTGLPPDQGDIRSSPDTANEDRDRGPTSEGTGSSQEDINKYSSLENRLEKLFDNLEVDREASPDDGTSHPGTPPRIIDDFKIIREIGKGGMGAVYEAEQISLKRKVALKILPSHLSLSEKSVLKFKREAIAGGRQSHPGIVAIYNVGEHDGIHFITQELVPGGMTLTDLLDDYKKTKDRQPGYFREPARLILEITRALQHAHDGGVIHRDIKPSNILLTKDGRPKVTDFGLAKLEDALSLSRTGDFVGTPYYMSPEQAMGRRMGIDLRTDIYSLGVTLYELLALRRPFEGKTTQDMLKSIMLVDPVSPSKIDPRVPRDLSLICLKAMEKNPDDRYPSMKAFGDDLERYLSGDVILARPTGVGTRFWKKVKRNPVISASVGVASIAAIIFAVVVPWVMYVNEQELHRREKENAHLLAAERDKAVAAEEVAQARYKQILRLSDVKRLDDLVEDAEKLWPAYPENIPFYESWLNQAHALLGRMELHKKTLAELRISSLPYGEAEREKDRESHPQWEALQVLYGFKVELLEKLNPKDSSGVGKVRSGQRTLDARTDLDPERLEKELEKLENRISEIQEQVSERRTWSFEDTETGWQHDMIADLVDGLENLANGEESLLKDVQERLLFASGIERKSIDDHRDAWDAAIVSIADEKACPEYRGLVIEPIIGIVPIGRDPSSGLWEFAHLQTGKIPERGEDGELTLTEESGMVFVLVPGGAFAMGARKPSKDHPMGSANTDPGFKPEEGPVHTVTLKPFFMSKFEMTQGQWVRFTGKNPSNYGPRSRIGGHQHDLLHPVENVSWYDCSKILHRLKLRLPTEAEWEYAARARTGTVYFTGDELLSLQGAANIADRSLEGYGDSIQCEKSLDDGYLVHARVGTFRANDFGLHDVHGNVFEWCEDVYSNSYDMTPVDGAANKRGKAKAVVRGGAWNSNASQCRSASRNGSGMSSRGELLGLRPCLSWIVSD